MVARRADAPRRKRVDSLTRKLLRDMKDGWKSFVAIWIICTLAIMLYVAIDCTWRCVDASLADQFAASNLADIWVSGQVSDRTARDIAATPGVTAVQRRVTVRAEAGGLDGAPAFELTMSDGEARINRPLIFEGGPFTGKDQCILQEKFAAAHGLRIGDSIWLTLGDRMLDIEIAGIGVLPEYVVTMDSGEFAPTPQRYGYALASPGTLSFLPMDEVLLTVTPSADVGAVREQIESLLEDRQAVVRERDDIVGIKMALDEAQQVRAMGAIFPVVFFVIAALITWTTMSRLVENQRTQIGALFAMGYGRRQLTWHFACYGLLLAALGCAAGLAGALYLLAPILMSFLNTLYVLPGAVLRLDMWVALVISSVIALITGGASVLSARAALTQSPSVLMRPRAPGKGRRVLLERIGGLWSRMRFSDKMITRNLARNPARLVMGLIGALGCAALMLTGFGMRDSTAYVFDNHYTRALSYDARAILTEDAAPDYAAAVAARAGATSFEEEMITGCEALMRGDWKAKSVFVLQDGSDMVRLHDGGLRAMLPDSGIALTRKAAEEFDLREGDSVRLRMPGGRPVEARIALVVDLQLGQGIYVSRTAWRRLDLAPWMPTDVLLRGAHLDLAAVEDMDGVSRARTLTEERDNSGNFLKIMNVIVLLLVLFSGVLALVVLYNLGQLNFSERVRELATLKVLGFTPREIKRLVLRENLLITLIALPLGLLAGPELHRAVLAHGLPNTIQFVPYIAPTSWVLTAALTVLFALFVNAMLGSKFHHINMVEALKSVE